MMTAQEKIVQGIRDYLIEKDGDKFLRLSEKDQQLLIIDVIQKHIDELKK